MEGLLTNYYEYHFLYISGIHHVESQERPGRGPDEAVLPSRHRHGPGDGRDDRLRQPLAGVHAAGHRAAVHHAVRHRQRAGRLPRALAARRKTIGEIQDQALFKVRPMFASLPGVSAPPPFGGNQRDDRRPASTPTGCAPTTSRPTTSSTRSTAATPSARPATSASGTRCRSCRSTRWSCDPQGAGQHPARSPGANVYLRDVGTIEDATDIPTGYALVNGRRAVYILVTKRADASTLTVVNEVKAEPAADAGGAARRTSRSASSSTSRPTSRGAMRGVGIEGLLGAVLTGLMVLLFLRDWRSVIVVVLNIPLALLGVGRRPVADGPDDQPHDARRAGAGGRHPGRRGDRRGREHPHADGAHADSIARAVRRGNAETAVPRLLAMLCILAVFIPSFFMEGAARALFVPLSLAVGFAMIASYLLSSTFVPVLSRLAAAPARRTGTTTAERRPALVRAAARRLRARCWPSTGPLAAGRRRTSSWPRLVIVLGWAAARHGDLPAGRRRPVPAPARGRRPARASS